MCARLLIHTICRRVMKLEEGQEGNEEAKRGREIIFFLGEKKKKEFAISNMYCGLSPD